MHRLLLVVSIALLSVGGAALSSSSAVFAAGGGNSDAAHLCQHGGYASLMGSDGTRFDNTGQCVSYAAHGGQLVAVSACSVTSTTGCLILSNVVLDSASGTGMVTLNGAISFGPADCPTLVCIAGSASGGGTYTTADGATGTFTVVGLEYESFNGPTCAQSTYRSLSIDISGSGGSTGYLQLTVNPDGSNNVTFSLGGTVVATGTNVSGLSISC